jgi:dienelactone hydrolase
VTLNTQFVPYAHEDLSLNGYMAWDDTQADPRPGILVLHGGAGLDAHAQDRAQRLARLGYVAFAADMYGEQVRGNRERIMQTLHELRSDPRRLERRAQAGLAVLAAHPKVDARRAAVGYCFGGLTALELARGGTTLAAVVSVHGSLHTVQPAEPGAIRARVLVCHGALDPHVPKTEVDAFADEMTRAEADWQLNVYGGAMHGFTHNAGPTAPGVAYHAVADARSSEALRQFLADAFAQA